MSDVKKTEKKRTRSGRPADNPADLSCPAAFDVLETFGNPLVEKNPDPLFHQGYNRLIIGDCLDAMKSLPSESIDLIYIDPPFFSGRDYSASDVTSRPGPSFTDKWKEGLHGYLDWLSTRLELMKLMLKPTGCLYVHVDWHAAHYVKCRLDDIFGAACFQNEIIWCYREAINSKKRWNRKHDNIFFYSKSESGFYFDPAPALEPHSETTIRKYRRNDEKGPYRLMGRGLKNSPIRSARDVDPEWEKTNPELVYRHYLTDGTLPVDYWFIDVINQSSKERTGYPTQKPEELLERIIACSSPPGGTVADFFCGSGTACAAASKLGRRWLGCDSSDQAISTASKRLAGLVLQSDDIKKTNVKKKKPKDNDAGFVVEQIKPEKQKKHRGRAPITGASNIIFIGDCLDAMKKLTAESIDLIYIDPPFCTGRERESGAASSGSGIRFEDAWSGGPPEYAEWLRPRLERMNLLLKHSGSIFIHLDWHAAHYVKCLADDIFGIDNFRNEIIWHYGSGGRASRFFSRKHDTILWYTKSDRWKFDETAAGAPRNLCRLCGSTLEQWNHMKKHTDPDGRVYRTIKSAGKIYKYYDDELSAAADVWFDINHLQQKDPERLGYPTQKPEALLERIIRCATDEGDVVADFFCGSGTTCAAAAKLGRRWIGCDISADAVRISSDRMTKFISTT